MAAFGDICLPYKSDVRVLMKFISSLVNLGYETIGINRTITPEAKPKRNTEKIPSPPDLSQLPGLEDVKRVCPRLKLLSRITVVVEEQSQLRYIAGEPVQSYDIVSVRPMNEKLFQQVCQTGEADVLSLDMTSRLAFYIKHPQVKLAIERGMSFEITYSPAIRDENLRRNVIANALELVRVCKGKNVTLSSGAESVMELRGPYDVTNLGLLFGLKQDQTKASVTKNIRSVIYHAEARNRTAKGVFGLEKLPSATGVKRGHVKVDDESQGQEMHYENMATSSKKLKV